MNGSDDVRAVCSRIVMGAIKEVMAAHPDYFTPRGEEKVCDAIAKRASGNLAAFFLSAQSQPSRLAEDGKEKGNLAVTGEGAAPLPRQQSKQEICQ